MARETTTGEIEMERAVLAGTSLEVSRVALGTWAIGGWMWGGTDEAESIATIRAAVEHGINLIDTAPVYGFGRSEEIVGKAIAEGNLRSRVLIATKAGLEWEGGKVFRNASRARILQEVEDSLRRHAYPVRAGQDPRHRRQQFLGWANGALPSRCAAACAAAAL
jgi:aryl-alcohol dehydrogenase-like predicted oxidoreductase